MFHNSSDYFATNLFFPLFMIASIHKNLINSIMNLIIKNVRVKQFYRYFFVSRIITFLFHLNIITNKREIKDASN